MGATRVQQVFVNFGHAADHFFMLIFPTVVLALAPELGRSYGDTLALSFGGFLAFGAASLPAGWLGDRWSRRGMMIVFFFGIGVASIIAGFATTAWQIAAALTLIGVFAAIYHPVGLALLVADPKRIGRALGWNGLCGNLGVAFAALATGALVDLAGWRIAFFLPGILSILAGIAFAVLVPKEAAGTKRPRASQRIERGTMIQVFAALLIATTAGGIVFNAITVAMPKVFDERLSSLTDTTFGIGALVCLVYVLAAFAQLIVGRLIDDRPLRSVFIPIAAFQAPLLLLAATLDNVPMLIVSIAIMFAIFGQIPINDAMVARCVDDEWRSRVFAVRYVVSFGASSLSVPLISYLHERGGFSQAFVVLAAIALCTFGAALIFPRRIGPEGGMEAVISPPSPTRRPSPLPAGARGSTGSD